MLRTWDFSVPPASSLRIALTALYPLAFLDMDGFGRWLCVSIAFSSGWRESGLGSIPIARSRNPILRREIQDLPWHEANQTGWGARTIVELGRFS